MKREYSFKNGKRGPVVDRKSTKVMKTIRLDLDVIEWAMREAAKRTMAYQTLINQTLREAMEAKPVSTEEEIRRIVRDELARKAS